jgi:hypothetical protein
MNNDEAKFILRAYRPSGRDATDPTFMAALTQAEHDPMLGAWFAREQGLDMVVAGKLREIMPPAGLRERILAGGRVSSPVRSEVRRRVFAWMGVAASIIAVLALTDVWQGRRAVAAQQNFAKFALQDTLRGDHHATHDQGMRAVMAMLGSDELALPGTLPFELSELKADGCRTLQFAGQETIEVCFERNGTWYHLYATARGALPRAWFEDSPAMLAIDNAAVAVWSDQKYDYAVVSPQGMAALKKLTG